MSSSNSVWQWVWALTAAPAPLSGDCWREVDYGRHGACVGLAAKIEQNIERRDRNSRVAELPCRFLKRQGT